MMNKFSVDIGEKEKWTILTIKMPFTVHIVSFHNSDNYSHYIFVAEKCVSSGLHFILRNCAKFSITLFFRSA